MIVTADLCNPASLRAAVGAGIERFGQINGVIHAAGAAPDRSFRAVCETGRIESGWHFEPKAYALFALEQALADLVLDFCFLDSSLSSVLGGVGYVAYASASLFLDSFVQSHNKRAARQPWTCVNWDAWRFEEEKQQLASVSEDLARFAITPEEGAEVFRRSLLSTGLDQIIVSTGSLASRIEQWVGGGPLKQRGKSEAGPSLHPRPSLSTPYVSPAGELEEAIAGIWQGALGIEAVGVEDNFFDLGGDSLLAVQVAAELRRELKMEVPVISLYEGLTIKSLVDMLKAPVDEQAPGEREARITRRKEYQQRQRSRRREVAG
jgi:acyl carrier protein